MIVKYYQKIRHNVVTGKPRGRPRKISPEGKFKGQNMVETLYSSDGQQYLNGFILLEISKNPRSFQRYPLMLEIIEENEFS